jgi:hypothetical protein
LGKALGIIQFGHFSRRFLSPLRTYVSRHGYYRSGSAALNYTTDNFALTREKLLHVTHHIPKIEEGGWAPDAWSGGALPQWFAWVQDENNLDPELVWRNVKVAIGSFMLGVVQQLCPETVGRHSASDSSDATAANASNYNVADNNTSNINDNASTISITDDYNVNVVTPLPNDSTCGSHAFHFTADLVVDSHGRAWVMEIHTTLGLKAPGLGKTNHTI